MCYLTFTELLVDVLHLFFCVEFMYMVRYVCRWLLPWETGISERISIQAAKYLHVNT